MEEGAWIDRSETEREGRGGERRGEDESSSLTAKEQRGLESRQLPD